MYIGLHAKSPLFLSDFEFFGQFSKNTQISNFMKNCQVGAELFHADRQTDTMKLIFYFHNIPNAPENFKLK